METVNISELRANLLKYLERTRAGEQFAVTSKGKVLATLTPPAQQREQAKKQMQKLAETAWVGDVITPIDEDWDVLS